jgi:hypothetical protein
MDNNKILFIQKLDLDFENMSNSCVTLITGLFQVSKQ